MLIVLAESARVTVSSWFEVGEGHCPSWQTPRISNSDDFAAAAFFVLEQSVSSLAPDFSRRTTARHMSVCLAAYSQPQLASPAPRAIQRQVRSGVTRWLDGWMGGGRLEGGRYALQQQVNSASFNIVQ